MSASSTLNTADYTTVWNDNFTTNTSLNTSLFPVVWGDASEFSFNDGLTITSDGNAAGFLTPDFGASSSYGYGLYSATVSMPTDQSPGAYMLMWPATNTWPGPEIDFVEQNNSDQPYMTVHWEGSGDTNQYQSFVFNANLAQPTTVAMDWEAGSLTFYLNGQEVVQYLAGGSVPIPVDYAQGGQNEAFGPGNVGQAGTSITIYDMSYSTLNASSGTQLTTITVSSGHSFSGTVGSGTMLDVLSGGLATNVAIDSGGFELITSGGTASTTAVNKGGKQEVQGTADGTVVSSGGHEYVSAGGVDSGAAISSGGVEYVSSGGIGRGAIVSYGGALAISSGGVASAAVISSGGKEIVYSGGVASRTVISSGGHEYVSAGGIDRSSVISSGGATFIYSAGTISGGTLIIGASLTVSSGGAVAAGLTLSGGTATISGTVGAGQEITFAGSGGDLALYNLGGFRATIGGFGTGDTIDLGTLVYSADETVSFTEASGNTSGTLTVVDGGGSSSSSSSTANLTLLGNYVTSDFALSKDPHGDTYVKFV